MKADWLLRAEAEQEQLWSQLCRLEAALSNENFMGQLDEETRQDLKDQRAGMAQYNAALSRRIKRNGGLCCFGVVPRDGCKPSWLTSPGTEDTFATCL